MVRPLPNFNHNNQGARRGSPSATPTTNRPPFTQTTLLGVPLDAADSESFGHNFPTKPSPNSSIITFQNIGPQPKHGFTSKARFNSRSFYKCKASIALYAEHGLNEKELDHSSLFATRMTQAHSPTYTYLANNTSEEATWNQTGGTGLSIHHSLLSHKTALSADPTGLGRWTFIRLHGKHGSSITFFSAYSPVETLHL